MKVDRLIQGCQVFNVYRKRFESADVAIIDDKFAYVGAPLAEIVASEVINGKGKWMIPGLVDIHLHVESTMLTPSEFSAGILVQGTTTAVTDPHEIANVFGVKGVQAMLDLEDGPADLFYGIPSSVPSTNFETTGGIIDQPEVRALLDHPKILCLGEVMNFHDLVAEGETRIKRLIATMSERSPRPIIEGHCPRLSGLDLQKFLFAGVDADHTQQTVESLREKIGLGMFVEIQDKSLSPELLKAVVDEKMSEYCCLVTDDTMVDILVSEGHLNRVFRRAVGMGLPVEEAIYLTTYTPARRMGLTDRGSIAPGRLADFVILDDVSTFAIHQIYKNGRLANTEALPLSKKIFPEEFYSSVHLTPRTISDFDIATTGDFAKCRLMRVNQESTFTEEVHVDVPVKDGKLTWENQGFGMIAVFDRYTGKNSAFGFVDGDCLKKGAIATTYAHDHHNLMVIGYSTIDMLKAANRVIEIQGGMTAVLNGEFISEIALPVAGILSDKPLASVAKEMESFRKAMESLGWVHHNPIMSLSTLSLPVSPALKISDQGLIDVRAGKIVSLIISE